MFFQKREVKRKRTFFQDIFNKLQGYAITPLHDLPAEFHKNPPVSFQVKVMFFVNRQFGAFMLRKSYFL